MASTAEPPTEPPSEPEVSPDEMSPLLGRSFAKQAPDDRLFNNLGYGTAWLAQIGTMVAILVIGVAVVRKDINLFSGHPLSQLVGFFALVQSILILQPTHLPKQKRHGQWAHVVFHGISFAAFVSGVTVIEYNKIHNGLEHFHSPHAYIGVATCVVLVVQYIFGVTMWAVPVLYGGENNAKKAWKYHRWSGYVLLMLVLASVASGTKTDYAANVLNIQSLYVIISCVVVFGAIFPQLSLKKLGLRRARQ